MTSFLSQLHWRNATKEFDPTRKVSDESLQKIFESIQLAPSSFGLQPYRILTITDQNKKQQIEEISWHQKQVTTCSHLLLFCADTDVKSRIARLMQLLEEKGREGLQEYESMMQGFLKNFSGEDLLSWTTHQTYLALGFGMAACAELQIDSCPMEGFVPEKLNTLLQLPENLKSKVMLPIGYRKNESGYEKVRFGEEELFRLE